MIFRYNPSLRDVGLSGHFNTLGRVAKGGLFLDP